MPVVVVDATNSVLRRYRSRKRAPVERLALTFLREVVDGRSVRSRGGIVLIVGDDNTSEDWEITVRGVHDARRVVESRLLDSFSEDTPGSVS